MLVDGFPGVPRALVAVRGEGVVRVLLHKGDLLLQFLHEHRLDYVKGALSDTADVGLLALLASHLAALYVEEQEKRKPAVDSLGIQSSDLVDDVEFADDPVLSFHSFPFDAAVADVGGVGDGLVFFLSVHGVSHVVYGQIVLSLADHEHIFEEVGALCVFEESFPFFADDESMLIDDPLVFPQFSVI